MAGRLERASVRRRYPLAPRVCSDTHGLRLDTIAREHASAGVPVVVSMGDAMARAHWSPAALRSTFGDQTVEAEETEEVYVGERARRRLPLARLIDGVLAGDASLRWKGLDLLSSVDGMKEWLATNAPSSDALLPGETMSTRRALWLAPKGTMSSFHHDGSSDNFNWQVHGRKLFLLAPPSSLESLYAYGSAESPINPFAPDLTRFPRFAETAALEATLEPGDVLLIPKYWWHCVYTVEASVNLNTWFHHRGELSPWRALAGAPLFHRASAALAAEMKRRELFALAQATRRLWCAIYEWLTPRPLPERRGELADP